MNFLKDTRFVAIVCLAILGIMVLGIVKASKPKTKTDDKTTSATTK